MRWSRGFRAGWFTHGLHFIASVHFSESFKRLMGTSYELEWREADEKARLRAVERGHPVAEGLSESFEVPARRRCTASGSTYLAPGHTGSDHLVSPVERLSADGCVHAGKGRSLQSSTGGLETHPVIQSAQGLR